MKLKLPGAPIALAASLAFILSGCAGVPQGALALSQESLETRQLQSKKYEGINEERILSASAGVLQDMGFTLVESETSLGVIIGNKDRSAVSAGQIALVFLAALGGANAAYDKDQKIIASLVTRPARGSEGQLIADTYVARVTFARSVTNSHNIIRYESLEAPELYQDFFEKLSKSVFLEGANI
ncbi:hypothetical protein I6N98_00125 [Spongiibacter nanhainus]|uniref:Uncharacterized protein n=1 Tax=Spongiibacter nanhainus TaxID=2794344 RepID=A0A7T4URF9_9GAMM|nr:hypothetical protein [Spongiibacter nanhainus]QQD18320.1 hypothetical protein I6N98_00125 [Spongiibacter nanhainus]